MKLGIHAYAWCSQWSNETLGPDRPRQVAGLGLHRNPADVPGHAGHRRRCAARLKSVGLEACTSTVLLSGTDITSDDPAVRRRGHGLPQGLRAGDARDRRDQLLGRDLLAARQAGQRPADRADVEAGSADALREVAFVRRSMGVQIGLEPVNRYETYLVNTCQQARKLKEMIGQPNVKIHLDTYHMNIEEKSFYEATRAGRGRPDSLPSVRERPRHPRHGHWWIGTASSGAGRDEVPGLSRPWNRSSIAPAT